MQARLAFRNDEEFERCMRMGMKDPKAVLRHDQLVGSEQGLFVATAITDTVFLKGIKKDSSTVKTQSLVIDDESGKLDLVESIRELV